MPDGWDIGTIIAIVTALGGVLAVWFQGRKNKHDAIRMINESYKELCDEHRKEIKELHDDATVNKEACKILREEQRAAEARIAALEHENRQLKAALAESEKERERLQDEVDELSKRLAKYESRPARSARQAE